ncbi:MAG: hypothetical protein ACI4SY_04460, partial [Sutterella sp.]
QLAADYRRHRSAVLPTLAQMLEKPCREYGQRVKTEGLGAVRIRLKSLLAAAKDRGHARRTSPLPDPQPAAPRTDADTVRREGRTLYAPQMAPIHFPLIAAALRSIGWRVSILPEVTPRAIELGLRHVNNDACYPAVVVIGQLLDLVRNNSAFDPARSALLLAQPAVPAGRATIPHFSNGP